MTQFDIGKIDLNNTENTKDELNMRKVMEGLKEGQKFILELQKKDLGPGEQIAVVCELYTNALGALLELGMPKSIVEGLHESLDKDVKKLIKKS